MKTVERIDIENYRKFLTKICKAYSALDDLRVYMEFYKDEQGKHFPSYFKSEHIDDCQAILEKQIGWDLLNQPKYLGLEALIKKDDV